MSCLYGSTVITFFFTPVIISSLKYPAPMEIPFLKEETLVNYFVNYSTQTIVQVSILTLMGVDLTLFVIFSFHIIFESYLIKKICVKLGESEACSFIDKALIDIKKDRGRVLNANVKPDVELEFTNDRIFLDDSHKSTELVKIILEYHNNVLR